jgi:short subunit dehydrogenase-like uncharacterized protein
MTGRWMIYGATGYTGRLVVEEAVRRGLAPVLAGRDAGRLDALARPLGLETRAVALDDPRRLAQALEGIQVVLNAAGPFAATALPIALACLATGAHYVDLTGEIPVFATLHRLDAAARMRGILLLPGAGFILVPSDCLVAHTASRLPGALWLRLGISRSSLVSRGSARTMLDLIGDGAWICRNGQLASLPWSQAERQIDYGYGARPALVVSWADVFTASGTTGIPNVETCLEVGPWEQWSFQTSRRFSWLLRTPPWQTALRMQADLLPEGPTAAQRAQDRRILVAVAGDAAGRTVVSRLKTPDAYGFTAVAAMECVLRVLGGGLPPGFQTPARVFGADFVLGLPGVVREDVGTLTP